MSNLRKIIAMILAATIICGNSQGLISYANEVVSEKSIETEESKVSKAVDTKAPELDVDSLKIDKNEVKQGDTVKISAKITDDNTGVKYVWVYYKTPITGKSKSVSLYYNNETDRYEGSIYIDESIEEGLWQINYIYICDKSNNQVSVYNSNINNYGEVKEDLSKSDFTVSGTNADVKAPELDVDTLKIDKKEVKLGDTINISIKITDDNSGVKNARVWYKTPITGKSKVIDLYYNNETDRYEGSMYIDESIEEGLWQISRIYMCDKSNNDVSVYNSNTNNYGTVKEDLSKCDFAVSGTSADVKAPELDVDTLKVDKKQVKPGDTVNISVKITDDNSGVKYVWMYYKTLLTGESKNIDLYYNSETDRYEGSMYIDESIEKGLWQINYIYMSDESNNSVYVYNSNTNKYGTVKEDLSNCDFKVVPDDNTTKPIENITVVTKNTSWSNKTINGDLYIGPNAMLIINSNVTVTGNVYVLGSIKTYGGLVVNGTLYGNRMITGLTSNLYNGSVVINGINDIYSINMSTYPVRDIPLRIDTTPLVANNGKLDIKGATLDIANMYIEEQLVELDYKGRFDLSNLYIGSKNSITVKFTTVFGNTITKEIKISNNINKTPEINADNVNLKLNDKFNPLDYVKALDKEDGDITNKVKVIENTVDTTKVGEYKVVYKVTDSQGASVTKTIKVTVNLNKVSNVKATASTYNSNKITWSKLTSANGYEIYRATSKTGSYKLIKTITSSSTVSYTNTSLATGSTYYYKIRAYRTVDKKKVYSSYSSITSAKPVLKTPSITLTAGSKKATVKWSKVSGANGYEIYRATSKTGKYSKAKTVTSGSTVSYTNTSLTKGKTYYYKVRAYRTVNGKKVYSSYSTVKSVKIK